MSSVLAHKVQYYLGTSRKFITDQLVALTGNINSIQLNQSMTCIRRENRVKLPRLKKKKKTKFRLIRLNST